MICSPDTHCERYKVKWKLNPSQWVAFQDSHVCPTCHAATWVKTKKPKASCYLPVHCLVAALKGMAANSLVRRSTFFAYVTRQKDGSAKNLGLVSTAEVLVHMRMHYLVMESIFVHCCICSSNLSFSKYCCICSLGLVQRSGQVYMVIFVNPSRVGGSLPVKSTFLNPCSSYSASLVSNTQMYSIFE